MPTECIFLFCTIPVLTQHISCVDKLDQLDPTEHVLEDVRFLQWCYCRCRFGMLPRVGRYTGPGLNSETFWTSWPANWIHYDPSKHLYLCSSRHGADPLEELPSTFSVTLTWRWKAEQVFETSLHRACRRQWNCPAWYCYNKWNFFRIPQVVRRPTLFWYIGGSSFSTVVFCVWLIVKKLSLYRPR